MANMFAKPVYDDEAPAADQPAATQPALPPGVQPAAGQNPPQSSASGNLFAQPQYDPDEPAPTPASWHGPVDVYNNPVTGRAADAALEIGKGMAAATYKASGAIATALGGLPTLWDKAVSAAKGHGTTEHQDLWFKTFVDPAVAADQNLQSRPGFLNQAMHAMGETMQTIAQAVVTGGEAAAPSVTNTVTQNVAGIAAHGVKSMTAPAVENAIDTGRKVLEQTGDKDAAIKAATTDYLSTAASGVLPASAEGNFIKRVGTGAGAQVALGETQRLAQNSYVPEGMNGQDPYTPEQRRDAAVAGQPIPLPEDQTVPFSIEQVGQEALAGGMFGGIMGHGTTSHGITEKPLTAMEQAQVDAAKAVHAQGGDALDQVKAAAHVNAVVGGVHDAYAYESSVQMRRRQMADEAAAQAVEEAQQSAKDTQTTQPAAEPVADDTDTGQSAPQMMRGQIPDEPDVNAVIARQEKNQAFEQAESQQADTRSAQEREAYNQRGQEAADIGIGAEKGGSTEPNPTLADTMAPEQRTAFESLKQRRAAEIAGATQEPSAREAIAAQNPEDKFQPLPPGAGEKPIEPPAKLPRTLAERRALSMERFAPKPGALKQLEAPKSDIVTERPGQGPEVEKAGRVFVNSEGEATVKTPTEVEARFSEPNGLLIRRRAAEAETTRAPVKDVTPVPGSTEAVEAAAREAAPHPENDLAEPTEAQHMAGNFKMGHTEVHGLPVTIEYPEGSKRPGPEGAEPREMAAHYGYVKGTVDSDGQATDVLIGKHPDNDRVFVVDHLGQDGEFEQHKSLMGFNNRIEALRAYRKAFPDNPMGPVKELSVDEYKDWLQKGDLDKPIDPRAVNRAKGGGQFSGDALDMHDQLEKKRDAIHEQYNEAQRQIDEHHANPDKYPGESFWDRLGKLKDRRAELSRQEHEMNGRLADLSAAKYKKAKEDFDAFLNRRRAARNGTENNASGESSASMEAISRMRQERANGQNRYLVDPDGKATPLQGVDSVDAKAPPGHIIVQRGIGIDTHTILDRGGLPISQARGLMNRARAQGELPEPKPAGNFREGEAPKGWDKIDNDLQSPRLTADQVRQHIAPLLKNIGEEGVAVHDSIDSPTLPEKTRTDMLAAAAAGNYSLYPGSIRGFYHNATDTVHIFADGHNDPEVARRTAVHEIIAHQGLRKLMGSDFAGAMRDIFKSAKNREWMQDFMEQHKLDPRNPSDQRLVGEEYAAHLAETASDPKLLQKIIDTVRAGLRKLGIVHEWSDNDIRALLRKSETNLGKMSATARVSLDDAPKQSGRFAAADDGPEVEQQFPADHPFSQGYKFGNTVESQANYNKGFIRSRMDWLKDKAQNSIETRLAFIPRRNLADFMPESKMPSLREFTRVLTRMDGRRNELIGKADSVAKDWADFTTKNKPGGRRLGELMHASTMLGVDPSKPFERKYDNPDAMQTAEENQRRSYHKTLSRVFNSGELGDKGRELYNTVRDFYKQQRQDTFKALQKRIAESQADEKVRQALNTQLREKFESGQVSGPYFPLARFGDYWASAKDKEGNVASFSRFESPSQQREWVANMKGHGLEVQGGKKMDAPSILNRVDPDFVHHVTKLADAVDPSLADDIWQHYLKAMPEMSMRKHFVHRQGRLGYTADALRAFAFNAFHGAHQQARLEYGNTLDNTIDTLRDEAEKLQEAEGPDGKNAKWAAPLYKEMVKRYEWARNPKSGPLASQLTKFGFGWYLGAAPATAFRVFTQNPMLAQPILAKKYGQLGASRELLRASGQWASSYGPLADKLRGDERDAFDEANRIGLFTNTNTASLASGGNGSPMYGWSDKATKVLGFMFQKMEEHNRETTFLASYRLARKQDLAHTDAIEQAENHTWDAHFDYSNANRPRVLQNDTAKVALLFRQYAWNVTYRLAREFRDMTKMETDPGERAAAAHAFGSLIGREMMFAGVTGLPLYWIAEKVVNTIMGDEDRPFNMTAAVHKQLNDQLGETAGDAIMTGPVGSIAGASLSGGASYNDLWLRDIPEGLQGSEVIMNILGQMAGPIAAVGTNMATGASLMHRGMLERGLEHFAPPAVAGPMKAIRYANEGAKNMAGEDVVPRKDITNKDLATQAIGFTPQHIADQFTRNSAIKGVAKAIQERRSLLLNQLFLALQQGDTKGFQNTMNDVNKFDERNPGVAIKTVLPSLLSHFKSQATAVNGVNLPAGLSDLYDQYGAPSK